ncbi:uncharacterized protein MONOS_2376 [Monocercomonoides exilis]|uniref:uncharacterized protein n=1 Tax=Monocercomonoides exilis TaxID=2049356 RepID=UPI00355A1CF7|nr:hypothetical protein MONOS_2376 [Monocercomonoides exilis]|eukprot:MONOS_2376.1-p1 / transcript=MONOS_2376.1 / gene=MONOS_2376 / organism=Monocercomonoides_exilis_PA203 / gene_product=unspecified product / transcript_product=unspecified product / location=Mono_scaffold00049:4859-10653(+) / protein_length=1776 / sequence_SO=supercontig / SO=protein_coding / is_pseudo=false
MGFTIAGKANCSKLAHAIIIARHLKCNLPSFEYEALLKTPEEWPQFISETQRAYGFAFTDCPTIWEEGRLVGGLQQWRELVANRYKLSLQLSEEQCIAVSKEIYQEFEANRRRQKTQDMAKGMRTVIEDESLHFTETVKASIGLEHHAESLFPEVKFIDKVMRSCGDIVTKLYSTVTRLQQKRRELEEISMKDAVSKKNAQLALEWIECRRIEQEAKDIEAKIAAEEAAARKRKQSSKKKKGKKSSEEKDADADKTTDDEMLTTHRSTTPKSGKGKRKTDSKGGKDKEKKLTAETVKESLEEELKKTEAERERAKREMQMLRIEAEVYITKIAELVDTEYPEPVIEKKEKKKKKKSDDSEEGNEEEEEGEEEEEEGDDEAAEEGEAEADEKAKAEKALLLKLTSKKGVIRNGEYIPLPGQGILTHAKTDVDIFAEGLDKQMKEKLSQFQQPKKKLSPVASSPSPFPSQPSSLAHTQRGAKAGEKSGVPFGGVVGMGTLGGTGKVGGMGTALQTRREKDDEKEEMKKKERETLIMFEMERTKRKMIQEKFAKKGNKKQQTSEGVDENDLDAHEDEKLLKEIIDCDSCSEHEGSGESAAATADKEEDVDEFSSRPSSRMLGSASHTPRRDLSFTTKTMSASHSSSTSSSSSSSSAFSATARRKRGEVTSASSKDRPQRTSSAATTKRPMRKMAPVTATRLAHSNLYSLFLQVKQRNNQPSNDSRALTQQKNEMNMTPGIGLQVQAVSPLEDTRLPFVVSPAHHSFRLCSALWMVLNTTPEFIETAVSWMNGSMSPLFGTARGKEAPSPILRLDDGATSELTASLRTPANKSNQGDARNGGAQDLTASDRVTPATSPIQSPTFPSLTSPSYLQHTQPNSRDLHPIASRPLRRLAQYVDDAIAFLHSRLSALPPFPSHLCSFLQSPAAPLQSAEEFLRECIANIKALIPPDAEQPCDPNAAQPGSAPSSASVPVPFRCPHCGQIHCQFASVQGAYAEFFPFKGFKNDHSASSPASASASSSLSGANGGLNIDSQRKAAAMQVVLNSLQMLLNPVIQRQQSHGRLTNMSSSSLAAVSSAQSSDLASQGTVQSMANGPSTPSSSGSVSGSRTPLPPFQSPISFHTSAPSTPSGSQQSSGNTVLSVLLSQRNPLETLFDWTQIFDIPTVTQKQLGQMPPPSPPVFSVKFLLLPELPADASDGLRSAWNSQRQAEKLVSPADKTLLKSTNSLNSTEGENASDKEKDGAASSGSASSASSGAAAVDAELKKAVAAQPSSATGTAATPKTPPQISAPALPAEGGILVEKALPVLTFFSMLFSAWVKWCEATTAGWQKLHSCAMDEWDEATLAEFLQQSEKEDNSKNTKVASLSAPKAQQPQIGQSDLNGDGDLGEKGEEERPPSPLHPEGTEGFQLPNHTSSCESLLDIEGDKQKEDETENESPNNKIPFLITSTIRRFASDGGVAPLMEKMQFVMPPRVPPKKLIPHRPIVAVVESSKSLTGTEDEQVEEEGGGEEGDNMERLMSIRKGGPLGSAWNKMKSGLNATELEARRLLGAPWWDDAEIAGNGASLQPLTSRTFNKPDGRFGSTAKSTAKEGGVGNGPSMTQIGALETFGSSPHVVLDPAEETLRRIVETTQTVDPTALAKRFISQKAQTFVHRLHQLRRSLRTLEWVKKVWSEMEGERKTAESGSDGEAGSSVDMNQIAEFASLWQKDSSLWPIELPAQQKPKIPKDFAEEFALAIIQREEEQKQREKEEQEREEERKRKEKEATALAKKKKRKGSAT